MTGYLKNETYYGAWEVALQQLEKIKRYFKNDRIVKDLIKVNSSIFSVINM